MFSHKNVNVGFLVGNVPYEGWCLDCDRLGVSNAKFILFIGNINMYFTGKNNVLNKGILTYSVFVQLVSFPATLLGHMLLRRIVVQYD